MNGRSPLISTVIPTSTAAEAHKPESVRKLSGDKFIKLSAVLSIHSESGGGASIVDRDVSRILERCTLTAMSRAGKIAAGIFIALAVYVAWGAASALIGFPGPYFSFLRPQPGTETENPMLKLRQTPIFIEHSVSKGVHKYSGVVNTPACNDLSAGLRTVGSEPARVQVRLVFLPKSGCNNSGEIGRTFSVSFADSKSDNAPVFDGLTINGISVEVNIEEK